MATTYESYLNAATHVCYIFLIPASFLRTVTSHVPARIDIK